MKSLAKTSLISFVLFLSLFLIGGAVINLFPPTVEKPETLERFREMIGDEEYAELTAEYDIKFVTNNANDGEIFTTLKEIRIRESTEKRMLIALCHEYGHYVTVRDGLVDDAEYIAMFRQRPQIMYGNYDMTEWAYQDMDEFCASYIGAKYYKEGICRQ